jgi:hypothetical protein
MTNDQWNSGKRKLMMRRAADFRLMQIWSQLAINYLCGLGPINSFSSSRLWNPLPRDIVRINQIIQIEPLTPNQGGSKNKLLFFTFLISFMIMPLKFLTLEHQKKMMNLDSITFLHIQQNIKWNRADQMQTSAISHQGPQRLIPNHPCMLLEFSCSHRKKKKGNKKNPSLLNQSVSCLQE